MHCRLNWPEKGVVTKPLHQKLEADKHHCTAIFSPNLVTYAHPDSKYLAVSNMLWYLVPDTCVQSYYIHYNVYMVNTCIMYRVSQNYPNMQFFAIFDTALKPLMLWFPKFSELLIRSQS